MAMRRSHASDLRVRSLTDVTLYAPRLSVGATMSSSSGRSGGQSRIAMGSASVNNGAWIRRSCTRRSPTARSMSSARSQPMAASLALDLVLLEDERQAIPPHDAVILASARLAREHPGAIAALKSLTGSIDADRMRLMNPHRSGRQITQAVAEEFLEGQRSKVKGQKKSPKRHSERPDLHIMAI